MNFFTYGDATEHALDYLGGTPDQLSQRDCRRAVLEAYREVTNARVWSYLYAHGRITTVEPYLAGTVAFDFTGGDYERELILYGGTWPAWAGPGAKVRIGVVTHDVNERKSDSVLTLTNVCPVADVDLARVAIGGLTLANPIVITSANHGLLTGATVIIEHVGSTQPVNPTISSNGTWTVTRLTANTFSLVGSNGTGNDPWLAGSGTWRLPPTTAYTLYQDDYPLPEDFVKSDTAIYEGNFGGLTYSEPTDQLWWQRFQYSSGTPRFYCLRGNPLFPGRLTIGFFPYPAQARTIDYIYQRRSRPLRIESYATGTITLTAASMIVTLHGGATSSTMAGSVLRVGTAQSPPTSWIGSNAPTFESVIVEVLSPTALRLADASPATSAAYRYIISDPVDIEQGATLTAFLRGVEKQLTIARSVKEDKADAFSAYDLALKEAQAADSRSFQGRAMGNPRSRAVPVKYMPARFF